MTMPCYFDMDVTLDPLRLIFKIPTVLWNEYDRLDSDQKKEFLKYSSFEGLAYESDFEISGDSKWTTLIAKIGPGVTYQDQNCWMCNGSGKDFKDRQCPQCFGAGKEKVDNGEARRLARAIAWILWIRNSLINIHKNDAVGDEAMLMAVEAHYYESGAKPMAGFYTKEFKEYLRANEDLAATKDVMRLVYNVLACGSGENGFADDRYRAYYRAQDDMLLLDVPGNSCGVNTKDSDASVYPLGKEEEVSTLSDHNIDSFVQQISVLAGLAHLNGEARRWLTRKKKRGVLKTKCILLAEDENDGFRVSIMRRHTVEGNGDWTEPDERITLDSYDYHWLELAPPPKLIGNYKMRGLSWEEFETEFNKYLESPEIEAALLRLIGMVNEHNVTIMCIEPKPDNCHRRLVAERCRELDPSLEIIME